MSATATTELNQTSYRDREGTEYHFWALTTGNMVVMEEYPHRVGAPNWVEFYSGQRLRNRLKVKASHTEWVWLVNSQTGGIHPALVDTVETGKIHFVGPRHKRAAT